MNSLQPLVCGIDEAGRGPLAGPVCAASVILPADFNLSLLDDSKKMTEKNRDLAMREIYMKAVAWGIGWASAVEIDSLNILQASLLAMQRSFLDMKRKYSYMENPIEVIIDGLYSPDICAGSVHAYPKADGTYPCVMAASILAKTARDRMMTRYSWFYPEYGYEKHKGYPTAAHRAAVVKNGPSPIQRKTFRVKLEGQLYLF